MYKLGSSFHTTRVLESGIVWNPPRDSIVTAYSYYKFNKRKPLIISSGGKFVMPCLRLFTNTVNVLI